MKKIIFCLSVCLITLASCSKTNTPKDTVKNYLENLKTGKYGDAINLLYFGEIETEEKEQLQEMAGKVGTGVEEKDGIVKYEITSETINEDNTSARVTADVWYGNEEEEEMDFTLHKIDNEWLIVPFENK